MGREGVVEIFNFEENTIKITPDIVADCTIKYKILM